jgi:hypothetical protein
MERFGQQLTTVPTSTTAGEDAVSEVRSSVMRPTASPAVVGAHRWVSVTRSHATCLRCFHSGDSTRRTPMHPGLRPPSALFRTCSDSTGLLVAPLAQRLAETPFHRARDRLLYGSEDVGRETRGLCDRALQVDPVARR